MTARASLAKRATAEAIGTALLLAVVVGSGIMGEELSNGQKALALLANTLSTGAGLVALIFTFGTISGAHFNPVVTLAEASQRRLLWSDAVAYIAAQISGAIIGVVAAHAMFNQPAIAFSVHERSGTGQWLAEAIATFGLLATIWGCAKFEARAVPFAVGAYITSAYWFTSSTSFANPAVTIARALTPTFAGIRPADVPAFIVAQMLGALAATFLFRWLLAGDTMPQIAMPHDERGSK